MTLFEHLSEKRDAELLKARDFASKGERNLVHFHTMAAIGFVKRLMKASIKELEQEV